MISDSELQEFRALVDAASPGPWVTGNLCAEFITEIFSQEVKFEKGIATPWTRESSNNTADAKFIAASRTMVPRLLEEVKEIRESNRLMERLWKDEIKKNVEILKAKDVGYSERNKLVSFLARLYPAHIKQHPAEDKDWESDWKNIVCIHSPTGQMTWHIHDSEAENFGFLNIKPDPFKDCVWDRHTTEEKYLRLGQLPPAQKENEDASLF